MLELFLLVLPIFILVGLGFITAQTGITNERTSEGLSDFFFIFATPALLFKLIYFNNLPENLPWGYILSYFISMALTWSLVTFVTFKGLKSTWGEAVIAGLSTGQANIVMMGIPLLISVYGEAAAAPIAFLMAFNLPITMSLATVLLESKKSTSHHRIAKNLAISLLKHPILMSIFIALLWRYFKIPFPKTIMPVLDMLAASAIPASLIALGMGLKQYGISGKVKEAAVVAVAKLLIFPTITYILAHIIFQLPPVWVGSAVIFASMPAGINAFIFAKRYGEGEDIASSAIAITTLLSLLTIVLWLSILPR